MFSTQNKVKKPKGINIVAEPISIVTSRKADTITTSPRTKRKVSSRTLSSAISHITAVKRARNSFVVQSAVPVQRRCKKLSKAQRFDQYFSLLSRYKDDHHGHNPPLKCIVLHNGTEWKLGKWCHNLRQRKGQKKNLSQQHVEKLNSINFSWNGLTEVIWNEHYALLKTYLSKHAKIPPRE